MCRNDEDTAKVAAAAEERQSVAEVVLISSTENRKC